MRAHTRSGVCDTQRLFGDKTQQGTHRDAGAIPDAPSGASRQNREPRMGYVDPAGEVNAEEPTVTGWSLRHLGRSATTTSTASDLPYIRNTVHYILNNTTTPMPPPPTCPRPAGLAACPAPAE